MNFISLSLYSGDLIQTYLENCPFLQEEEYLCSCFILSMYIGFWNVRHFPRCSWNFFVIPRPRNQHNTKVNRKDLRHRVFMCFHDRDYARKSLFILQWNNIITKLHSSVTLTVHQSGKCQIHRVSQREVGWNCCYIKVTMLLCFKHAAILQSVNDAGVLIDIHSTVLWNQKSPLYTCLCYRNNSRL